MKAVWRIYDNYTNKVLDGSYDTREKAKETMEKAIVVRKGRKESFDLNVFVAEYIVKHNDIYDLQCDVERLEYFRKRNDADKVKEYLELIALHVKNMIDSQE